MSFSTSQYPSEEDTQRDNQKRATAAAIRTEELLREQLKLQKNQKSLNDDSILLARIQDMLNVLPNLLDLDERQENKLKKTYPIEYFMKPKEKMVQTERLTLDEEFKRRRNSLDRFIDTFGKSL